MPIAGEDLVSSIATVRAPKQLAMSRVGFGSTHQNVRAAMNRISNIGRHAVRGAAERIERNGVADQIEFLRRTPCNPKCEKSQPED